MHHPLWVVVVVVVVVVYGIALPLSIAAAQTALEGPKIGMPVDAKASAMPWQRCTADRIGVYVCIDSKREQAID